MDVALRYDPGRLACDYAIANGDLVADNGLATAVLISLFSDRLAASDDAIPDGTDNRRGWWGDLPVDGATPASQASDFIGCRWWLLARAKDTTETLNAAGTYGREALQWMIDDGVAQEVDVFCEFHEVGTLAARVDISRLGPNGRAVDHRFDLVWSSTVGTTAPVFTARLGGILDFSNPANSGLLGVLP
jgi:phage gp46-like protein